METKEYKINTYYESDKSSSITLRDRYYICPCCQRIDTVEVTLRAPGYDRAMTSAISLKCPECSEDPHDPEKSVEMYEVDYYLIKGLAAMNAAGIVTGGHCSMVHNNGGINPDFKDIKLIGEDGKTYREGPHIIINTLGSTELHRCMTEVQTRLNNLRSHYKVGIMSMRDFVEGSYRKDEGAAILRYEGNDIDDSYLIWMMTPRCNVIDARDACDDLVRYCEVLAEEYSKSNDATFGITTSTARKEALAQSVYINFD